MTCAWFSVVSMTGRKRMSLTAEMDKKKALEISKGLFQFWRRDGPWSRPPHRYRRSPHLPSTPGNRLPSHTQAPASRRHHFLLPGLLGREPEFNRDFRQPIEQQGDCARNAYLVRRIKPFLLRRTKDVVAKELPPKTTMVRFVELSGTQRDLYETVRVAMDEKVSAAIAERGAGRSHIIMLEALLKLRQVCCDPRLLAPDRFGTGAPESAKLAELLDMLEELLAEGHKVLVFSQFTSMLALIEAELTARNIAYSLLTGQTRDRAAVVRQFQQGAAPVFLISLKAGGVGLNLTAADTVIHYDPWWNPAAEDQASDRAWRIGQDKPVFVYKLIARGTLEEKIQLLQEKKASMAEAVLGGKAGADGQLSAEDLRAIFAPLPA